jgi:hypothetical protein
MYNSTKVKIPSPLPYSRCIIMPYIGGVLSKNSYKFPNGGTKPVVKHWMNDLACQLDHQDGGFYEVRVHGRFTSNVRPDMQNLFEVISDAVQRGLGVNDKNFTLVDAGYSTGHIRQHLVITVVRI